MMMTRRTLFAAAALLTMLAIYGSLVPLRYEPIPFSEALNRFRGLPYLDLTRAQRADWVANVLLFIPLAFLWNGAITRGNPSRPQRIAGAIAVGLAGLAVATSVEFIQQWFPDRTVSANDILAETIGGVIGSLLWVACGEPIASWVRTLSKETHSRSKLGRLLALYTLGLVVYSVLPLDLTLSSGDLAAKVRDGMVTLTPFSDVTTGWNSLYGLVRDVALFVPIGMLTATWRVPLGTRLRSIGLTTAVGLAAAAALELAQLFVLSRFSSTTDVILGGSGAAIGGAIAARCLNDRKPMPGVGFRRPVARRLLQWMMGVCGYAGILVVIFCAPFAVSGSPASWRARYEGFWIIPFSRLYRGSEFNAISDSLRKTLLFAGLGILLAGLVRSMPAPAGVRPALWGAAFVGAAGLAAGIELFQVVLPPHVPDVTDVVLGSLGGLAGLIAGGWLFRPDRGAF